MVNVRLKQVLQSDSISYLAIGSSASATAAGDLSAGDGSTEMFFDASTGSLSLSSTAGSLNVGAGITPSTANGDIVAGDGTRSLIYDASTGTLTLDGALSNLRIGTVTTPSTAITIGNVISVASNTTVVGLITSVFNSAGAGGDGLGSTVSFQAENASSTLRSQGSVGQRWRDASDLAEYGEFFVNIKRNGVLADRFILGNTTTANGNLRAEFNNNAGTRTVTVDMDQESLQVGQGATAPAGTGDVTASGTGYFSTGFNVGTGFTATTTAGSIKAGTSDQNFLQWDESLNTLVLKSSRSGIGTQLRIYSEVYNSAGNGGPGMASYDAINLELSTGSVNQVATWFTLLRSDTSGFTYADQYWTIDRNAVDTEVLRLGNSQSATGTARVEIPNHGILVGDVTNGSPATGDIFSSDGTRIFNLDMSLNTTTAGVQGDTFDFQGPGATTAATSGGGFRVLGGQGNTTGAGGQCSITAGQGGATGTGGAAFIAAGSGGVTSGGGGTAQVLGGAASTSGSGGTAQIVGGVGAGSGSGGDGRVRAGNGAGSGTGGTAEITAGDGGATGNGGPVTITAGDGGATSGNSGAVTIDVGTVTSGTTGAVSIGATNCGSSITIGNTANNPALNFNGEVVTFLIGGTDFRIANDAATQRFVFASTGNIHLADTSAYSFSSTSAASGTQDTFLQRSAAGVVEVNATEDGGGDGDLRLTDLVHVGANGSITTATVATQELTGLSGATVSTSGLVPAGSKILYVTAYVTTTITGATTFDIGETDIDRWGAAIALTAGTTVDGTDYTADPAVFSASAQEVTLTANGSNFTAGAVRIVAYYETPTAPTS